MIKKIIAIFFIFSLFSCVIEIEDEPDYVGSWVRSTGSNTSLKLVITQDSYSVSEVTTSNITGISTIIEIERGTLTNPTSTIFTLTKTHLYEPGLGRLDDIPPSMQNPSNVSWSVSGSQLTLIDNVNTFTNGTFTKQ